MSCIFLFISVLSSVSLDYSRHACVDEVFEMECPTGHFLVIKSAIWGRQNTDKCFVEDSSVVTSCVADVTTIIGALCDGNGSCDIVVDPEEYGADPCPETSKYLQISFACESKYTEIA